MLDKDVAEFWRTKNGDVRYADVIQPGWLGRLFGRKAYQEASVGNLDGNLLVSVPGDSTSIDVAQLILQETLDPEGAFNREFTAFLLNKYSMLNNQQEEARTLSRIKATKLEILKRAGEDAEAYIRFTIGALGTGGAFAVGAHDVMDGHVVEGAVGMVLVSKWDELFRIGGSKLTFLTKSRQQVTVAVPDQARHVFAMMDDAGKKQILDEFAQASTREQVEAIIHKLVRQADSEILSARHLRLLEEGVGFKTFAELKEHLGPPPPGHAWHHIVNTANVIAIPHGKGSMHQAQIEAFLNSHRPEITGQGFQRVRDWLKTKSYQFQYEFGVLMLRNHGVLLP
jgi:hypothetical protein